MEELIKGTNKLGIHLTENQLDLFEKYYHELVDWSRKINLTSILSYKEVQIKHFLDSLTIIPLIEKKYNKIIDIGSGAGFPGIPLKIVIPEVSLTLLDSVGKKTNFLNHLSSILQLDNFNVITARSEETAQKEEYREQFDVVISRALASLPTAVELTVPFCKPGGICIYQKKGNIQNEIKESIYAISILGGQIKELKNVSLSELSDNRILIVVEKVDTTPLKYPRRTGVPTHRPLTAPIPKTQS
ncbi:MAG: 16S rRNA (guanine(527)-N(7))-methyltransferase RsmG [Chloroflexi bacterium]|nr:16S rRNA (guanine(527)-N(7))-methyltransferase RsmG [Chloroflexota bacterium]